LVFKNLKILISLKNFKSCNQFFKFQIFQNFNIQKFQNFKFQNFNIQKFQNFKFQKFQNFKLQKFQVNSKTLILNFKI